MSATPTFQKFGGLYQLQIKNHEDLKHILELPEPCWVATSAPCTGLAVDPVFTNLVDFDQDGRIRCDEIRTAVSWTLEVLADFGGLNQGSTTLNLSAIAATHPEGSKIKDRAEQLVKELDKGNPSSISLEEVRSLKGSSSEVGVVEKLILFQAHLLELVNNFVSFPRLYDYDVPSLFQMGTLYLGARELTFNVKVDNLEAHQELARQALMFVMYVQVTHPQQEASMTVATAVTAGCAKRLHKGRRGVFRTRDGELWDAVVLEIINNPVSLWEATKLPFIRIGEFLESQAEKITSAHQEDLEKQVDTIASQKAADPKAGGGRITAIRDLMLSVSVSFAALASAFAFVTKSLVEVAWWKILLVLLGMVAVLVVPLVVLGALKLARRNMSALLTAGGWAINDAMYLRAGLGHLFTRERVFPKGADYLSGDEVASAIRLHDPTFAKRKFLIKLTAALLVLAVILCLAYKGAFWPF